MDFIFSRYPKFGAMVFEWYSNGDDSYFVVATYHCFGHVYVHIEFSLLIYHDGSECDMNQIQQEQLAIDT
jgi:hypothetical protein